MDFLDRIIDYIGEKMNLKSITWSKFATIVDYNDNILDNIFPF